MDTMAMMVPGGETPPAMVASMAGVLAEDTTMPG